MKHSTKNRAMTRIPVRPWDLSALDGTSTDVGKVIWVTLDITNPTQRILAVITHVRADWDHAYDVRALERPFHVNQLAEIWDVCIKAEALSVRERTWE